MAAEQARTLRRANRDQGAADRSLGWNRQRTQIIYFARSRAPIYTQQGPGDNIEHRHAEIRQLINFISKSQEMDFAKSLC